MRLLVHLITLFATPERQAFRQGQRDTEHGIASVPLWQPCRPVVETPRPDQPRHADNDRGSPRASSERRQPAVIATDADGMRRGSAAVLHPNDHGCDGCFSPAVGPRVGLEAHPDRISQSPAGQREAERVVLVDQINDEAEAAVRVEEAEGGDVHCIRSPYRVSEYPRHACGLNYHTAYACRSGYRNFTEETWTEHWTAWPSGQHARCPWIPTGLSYRRTPGACVIRDVCLGKRKLRIHVCTHIGFKPKPGG
jgi:hypothetical protein